MTALVLGSGSGSRRRMLEEARLAFDVSPPEIDEDAVKDAWTGTPAGLAAELARLKGAEVSGRLPERTVIAADQVLDLDGEIFSKPADRDRAGAQLGRLAGRTHILRTAMCVMRGGAELFRAESAPRLTVAPLTRGEIDAYVAAMPDDALGSVGGYQVEGLGIRLFERIEGGWHDIMGLPLLPLLGWLRRERMLSWR